MRLVILANFGEKVALWMSSVHTIGIICEDASDYSAIKTLIARLAQRDNLSYKKKEKGSCSYIKSKGLSWAIELHKQGCEMLIVVHDLDDKKQPELLKELEDKFSCSPFSKYYLCIPIEEIEAWFLTDPQTIKRVFRLERLPKLPSNTETVKDPKEYLREVVRVNSKRRATYINTSDNLKLALELDIEQAAKRSNSFKGFADFISAHSFS